MNIKSIKEMKEFIRHNVNYVNQQLTLLERADKHTLSRAYSFVQDKLRNLPFMKFNKQGNVRFKSTNTEISELPYSDVKKLYENLKDYKETSTGSLYKVNRIQDKYFEKFKEQYEDKYGRFYDSNAKSKEEQEKWEDVVRQKVSDLYSHRNYDKAVEMLGSDFVMRLIDSIGIDETKYILDLFDKEEITKFEIDNEINMLEDLKKQREKDRKKEKRGDRNRNMSPRFGSNFR